MSIGVLDIIGPGVMKVEMNPISNLKTCDLHLTVFLPNGSTGSTATFTTNQLTRGVQFSLKTKCKYQLDLMLTSWAKLCTAALRLTHNGTVIWDGECTKFCPGFSGEWTYKIQ